VQPVEVESKPDGRLALLLRCPECQWWGEGTFPAERVREYDRLLSEGREELRAIYRRTLRDNLYRELRGFVAALDLDLIGADDFARPRRYAARFSAYQA
jgi:hypothetical protein